jgi:hypothetical protein
MSTPVYFKEDSIIYKNFKSIVIDEERKIGDCLQEALREWMLKYKKRYPTRMPPTPNPIQPIVIQLSKQELQQKISEIAEESQKIIELKQQMLNLRLSIYKNPSNESFISVFEKAIIDLEVKKQKLENTIEEELVPQTKFAHGSPQFNELIRLYKEQKLF